MPLKGEAVGQHLLDLPDHRRGEAEEGLRTSYLEFYESLRLGTESVGEGER